MKIHVDMKRGHAVPDGLAAETVTSMLAEWNEQTSWMIGTSALVNELRLRRMRQEILDLTFVYEGKELPVDADGRIPNWPPGFADIIDRQLSELLSSSRRHPKDV